MTEQERIGPNGDVWEKKGRRQRVVFGAGAGENPVGLWDCLMCCWEREGKRGGEGKEINNERRKGVKHCGPYKARLVCNKGVNVRRGEEVCWGKQKWRNLAKLS